MSIATLSVKLVANIAGFTSMIQRASAPLKSFGAKVAVVGEKLKGMAALSTLVTGGSTAALVHGSLEAIDATGKLADRLGVTTEAMVGLQHAAKLADVSNEELTGGLEKMLKNLSEAATAGGPAADTFKAMGLNAKQLASIAPDQAFEQIAQGLTDIQNPAQRAQAAMDIFGKSGQSLLPLLMSGAEGIKAAKREAEALGITFNHLEFDKVQNANDAITRMKEVFSGVANRVAIALAPTIEKVADWVRVNKDLVLSTVKWVGIVGAGLIVIPKFIGGITAIGMAVSAATRAVMFMGGPVTALVAAAGLVAAVAIRAAVANETWADSAYHVTRAIGGDALLGALGYSKALLDLGDSMEAFGRASDSVRVAESELAQVKGLDDKLDASRELVRALEERLELAKKIIKLEQAEGSDMGVNQGTVDYTRRKLAAAQASLERLQKFKSDQKASAFGLPDAEAVKSAQAIQTTIDKLREQAATAGMTAQQVEMWKLASEGATAEQMKLAAALAAQADAAHRAADVNKTLADLQKSVADFGITDAQKKIAELEALGGSSRQLWQAWSLLQQLDQLQVGQKAAESIAELRKEIDQFNMTDSQKKFADLKSMGVGPQQLAQAQKLLAQLDALNAAKAKADQMTQDAKSIYESTRTPLERYEATIGRLSDLLNAGAIDWDTYGRAVRQAIEARDGVSKVESPSMLKVGSAAADQYRFDQARGVQRLSKDDVSKKQLQEQQSGNRLLDRIERNTRDANKDQPVTLSL